MFKIVETIEKGSKTLTIIPSGWESNGQLAWPKFRVDKLIKIADSLPDEDSWFRMNCKLKRNYLLNYEIAEEELERMLERDDTEQEESVPPVRSKRVRVLLPKRNSIYDGEDFNTLADACSVSETSPVPLPSPENQTPSVKIISHKVIGVNASTQPQNNTLHQQPINVFENNNNTGDVLLLSDAGNASDLNSFSLPHKTPVQVEEKLDKILANQKVIIQNQNAIMQYLENTASNQNQTLILQQLATFEAIFDTFGNSLAKNSYNNTPSQKETEDIINVIDQIDTLNDLEKFEQSLKEKKTMEYFVGKLSFVCGRQGTGNGANNCYLLVDRIFSRKFMTLCSWAGGARDKKEKIPFKVYKNIINLFFKVIHLSDKNFTLKDYEEFFKNVIRNSTRRNQSNMIRNSAIKRRPKNLNYKKGKEGSSLSTKEKEKNSDNSSENEEGEINEEVNFNKDENGGVVEEETLK